MHRDSCPHSAGGSELWPGHDGELPTPAAILYTGSVHGYVVEVSVRGYSPIDYDHLFVGDSKDRRLACNLILVSPKGRPFSVALARRLIAACTREA
jgi:hypothetical protein